MTTDQTTEQTVDKISEWFEFSNRPKFVRLKDGAPEWLLDAVRLAHDDELPNDWRWSMCWDIVESIEELSEELSEDVDDALDQIADSLVQPLRKKLVEWLAENISRGEYCNEYAYEYGTTNNVFDMIAGGQRLCLRQMAGVLYRKMRTNAGY